MKIETKNGSAVVAGYVARDAELKIVGSKNTPKTGFSVAVARGADGRSEYVNCVAWRELADYAAHIKAGCYAMVAGVIEERDYNGKTYRDLRVDFVMWVNPADATAQANARDMAGMTPDESYGAGEEPPPF